MSFVPGSVAAEKLGGQPASQAQRGKEGWGSCQGLFCSNRPLEHPPGPLPHTPTRYGLHSWAWASLGTISGPFFLKCCLHDPFLREDGDTKTASWGCN